MSNPDPSAMPNPSPPPNPEALASSEGPAVSGEAPKQPSNFEMAPALTAAPNVTAEATPEPASAAAVEAKPAIAVPRTPAVSSIPNLSEKAAPSSALDVEVRVRRMTRRAALTGSAALFAGWAGLSWLGSAAQEDRIPWPLRRILRFNQSVAEALYSSQRLTPTFPRSAVDAPARMNGFIGLDAPIDARTWQLRVDHAGRPSQSIGLSAVTALRRTEWIAELKCVEGWSQVMQFAGVSFRDFVAQFHLGTKSGNAPDPVNNPQDLYRYVYLATPSEDYYVGLDMASVLHPQTLLCDTMNDQPLSVEHGAPLRLYIPVKYGIKNLKRISIIRFQDEQPPDYWAERGYDWYAGL